MVMLVTTMRRIVVAKMTAVLVAVVITCIVMNRVVQCRQRELVPLSHQEYPVWTKI